MKRAVRAGLRNKGDKYKRKYFGKNWRNLTNAQAATMVGKKVAGLGAKAALAYAGATAAGIASITGGDMEKGASNMIAAGVGGYALGKGISNKINSIDHKSDIDAMREAYYGDEYKAVQQKEAEKKFAKDEENLKKIEQKLKVDREKAKEIAKTNLSGTTSFSNNSIQNAKQLSDANKHNLRDYDKNRDDIFVIYGSNNLFNDVRDLYLQEFEQARIEYNQQQTREDRKIKDYFNKISQDSQRDLACEIIIELGDMDFWKDKDMRYKKRMSDVYNEQVKDLMKVVPEFKVANAVIHYDETSPHMHIIGVPVKEDYKKGMRNK